MKKDQFMIKKLGLLSLAVCLNHLAFGIEMKIPAEKFSKDSEFAKECQRTAELLINAFAYTEEELRSGSEEGENIDRCGGGQHGTLLRELKKNKNSGKRKVIGFIDQVPVLESDNEKLTDDQKKFEKDFVRVFTLGNGLCFFHSLGIQKTEAPINGSVKDPERTFPYFEITDTRCRLNNAYSVYETKIEGHEKDFSDDLKKAKSDINLSAVSDMFEFFKSKSKEFRNKLREFYYGNIKEKGEKAEERREAEEALKELRSHCLKLNQLRGKFLLSSENNKSSKAIKVLTDIINAISSDVMLTSTCTWPSYATLIPAYINFSKTLGKKAALFYKEVIDYDNDILPLCKWTILDKDPENAEEIYRRIREDSDFEEAIIRVAEERPRLNKLTPANQEDSEKITDYVVLEMSHASRVIPRKFLESVKKILADREEILTVTVDEQGNIINKTEEEK